MSGMMDTSDPVTTSENRSAFDPDPPTAWDDHEARPTVMGYRSGVVQHDERKEVVVPGRDEGEEQDCDHSGAEAVAVRCGRRCGTLPPRRPGRPR